MSRTVVRFRADAPSYHAHRGIVPYPPGRSVADVRGREVTILLPPHPAREPLPCGCYLVWHIPPDELLQLLGGPFPDNTVGIVCACQLELD